MTLMQFSGLLVVWLLSTLFIATATGLSSAACALTSTSFSRCCSCSPFFLRLPVNQYPGIPL